MKEEDAKILLEKLEKGIQNLSDSEEWKKFLEFSSKLHHYSFNNQMLLNLQTNGKASDVGSYRFWAAQGAFVKKGEKALYIYAPRIYKVKEKTSLGEEKEISKIMGFNLVPVFDRSQLANPEVLPSVVKRLEGTGDKEILMTLKKIAEAKSGWTVEYSAIPGETNGYCSPSEKKIVVDNVKNSPEAMLKTLCHEIAHQQMHADIPDAHDRSDKELMAESVAFIVGHYLAEHLGRGFDSSTYTFGYVTLWKGNKDNALEDLRKVAGEIIKTAGDIIQGVEDILMDKNLSGKEKALSKEYYTEDLML